MCVLPFEDVFPYAFCVCSTRMRGDFVVMLANKVRRFCRRPHLVSAGILCSSASTHFCSLYFYPFLNLSKQGNRECLFFYFICLISSFTSSPSTRVCPASSLTGSMTAGNSCMQPPHCVPFDRASLPTLHQTPRGGYKPCFPFLETN